MLKKMINNLKSGGIEPPYFLISKKPMDIRKHDDIVLNIVIKTVPNGYILLMHFESFKEIIKNIKYKKTTNGNTTTFQKIK